MTQKKLYRSKNNRMIAGICGGLGEYFNIDPTVIRLAAVFFTLWWGGGLLLYLIAWFVIPEEPEQALSPRLLSDATRSESQQTLPEDETGEVASAD